MQCASEVVGCPVESRNSAEGVYGWMFIAGCKRPSLEQMDGRLMAVVLVVVEWRYVDGATLAMLWR